MRRLLKESKKKAFPHQKSYKRSKEQYEKLKGEYQSVQNQVENVREQLQKILKRNPAKPIDENGDKKKKESTEQIPYASKYAIQKKVEENSKRLGRIDQRLEELFETSKIDKIAIQVDKRFDRVADKVTQIEKEIQGLQLSIEDKHIVKVLVSRIKELQQLLNEFLKAIEISIHFGLLIEDQPPHEIDFELKFFKEGKALESYSELKRVEKAYLSLCFIFTLYEINELRLIPISTDLLPQKITTTKTFTKAVKLLEHNINKHLKDVRVLLFLENEYEGINNVLAMKKMEKTTKN